MPLRPEVSARAAFRWRGGKFRPMCELVFASMSESTIKGAIAEAAITAAAVELGIYVLRPLVEGRRYDLVFDVQGRLLRVQCKWAPRRGNVLAVNLQTHRCTPHGYVRSTYSAAE